MIGSEPWWLTLLKHLASALSRQRLGDLPPGSVSGTFTAELGHMGDALGHEEKVERLRRAGQWAVSNPEWVAHDITGDGRAETFCNRAARSVAEAMGCRDFEPTDNANMMQAKMAGGWREVPAHEAAGLAMKGYLLMASVSWRPHGHICAVMPEPAQPSGSWGCDAPMVAHVGGGATPNGVVKASQAFLAAQRPALRFYCWGPQ